MSLNIVLKSHELAGSNKYDNTGIRDARDEVNTETVTVLEECGQTMKSKSLVFLRRHTEALNKYRESQVQFARVQFEPTPFRTGA